MYVYQQRGTNIPVSTLALESPLANRLFRLTPADDNILESHIATGYPSGNRNCFIC